MLKEIQEGQVRDLEVLRKEYYEREWSNLKPITLSIIDLGENDRTPVIVRQNTISILKKNSEFTAYSQYINKNVVDIQLAYEKNANRCRLSVVRKLFKNKSKRELTLAFISLFKAIYAELIIRMDKKFEEGSSFPNALYDIPSQTIKFDLLKLLRTQLSIHGADAFDQCLMMIKEFEELVVKKSSKSHRASKISNILIELTPFFTEILSNTIRTEIHGFYEYVRDVLWFANWLIESNLDTKDTNRQLDLTYGYAGFISQDRSEMKSYDSL